MMNTDSEVQGFRDRVNTNLTKSLRDKMKGHRILTTGGLIWVFFWLPATQRSVNSVNVAINSFLSSLEQQLLIKRFRFQLPVRIVVQRRPLPALVLSAKTMKKHKWQRKNLDWQKDPLSPMPLFLKPRRAEVPRHDDRNAQIST